MEQGVLTLGVLVPQSNDPRSLRGAGCVQRARLVLEDNEVACDGADIVGEAQLEARLATIHVGDEAKRTAGRSTEVESTIPRGQLRIGSSEAEAHF